jgi:hypothetical protein
VPDGAVWVKKNYIKSYFNGSYVFFAVYTHTSLQHPKLKGTSAKLKRALCCQSRCNIHTGRLQRPTATFILCFVTRKQLVQRLKWGNTDIQCHTHKQHGHIMCVRVYVCTHVCVYVCVCMYVCMCARVFVGLYVRVYVCMYVHVCIYKVSQEEWTKLRESVPCVKIYRYNPKHLYPS